MALGVPDQIQTFLFDMDGVLTQTAKVHAAAWKATFDEVLKARAGGGDFKPFDPVGDYGEYVDGEPRYDGVKNFLASRGIGLPHGSPDDNPRNDTIDAVGNAKNERVQELIRTKGVDAYPGTVRYLDAVKAAGHRCAVVSSSANTHEVLRAAGIADYFDAVVDASVAEREGLAGKPAPDTFLAAARMLEAPVKTAVVFEDALAGVAAGRAGGFGLVVGVDRLDHADALREHGADVVVEDVADLLTAQ